MLNTTSACLVELIMKFVINDKDIAKNIVAGLFLGLPTIVFGIFTWSKLKIALGFKHSGVPINLRLFCLLHAFRDYRQGKPTMIDGFYFATYQVDRSGKKSPEITGRQTNKNDRPDYLIAECIYIHKRLFSNTVICYLLRRVKHFKDGRDPTTDEDQAINFGQSAKKRMTGSYSSNVHFFYGYWLHPFSENEAAGTFTLQFRTAGDGQPHTQKFAFDGTWSGHKRITTNTPNDSLVPVGGNWNFIRVATTTNGFAEWRKSLHETRTNPAEDAVKFATWEPK
jgi:hypothetical protein